MEQQRVVFQPLGHLYFPELPSIGANFAKDGSKASSKQLDTASDLLIQQQGPSIKVITEQNGDQMTRNREKFSKLREELNGFHLFKAFIIVNFVLTFS